MLFVRRGNSTYAALDWAIELGRAAGPDLAPVLARLKYPEGDFSGDVIVLAPRDARQLASELGLAEPPSPGDDAHLQTWREAVGIALAHDQPILIGYGY